MWVPAALSQNAVKGVEGLCVCVYNGLGYLTCNWIANFLAGLCFDAVLGKYINKKRRKGRNGPATKCVDANRTQKQIRGLNWFDKDDIWNWLGFLSRDTVEKFWKIFFRSWRRLLAVWKQLPSNSLLVIITPGKPMWRGVTCYYYVSDWLDSKQFERNYDL